MYRYVHCSTNNLYSVFGEDKFVGRVQYRRFPVSIYDNYIILIKELAGIKNINIRDTYTVEVGR